MKLARDQVLRLLAPASDAVLEKALAALSLLVTRQGAEEDVDEDTAELQLALYVARLRDYPEDIALNAIETWPDRSQFWPAWKQLKDVLDADFAWRRQLLPALQQIVSHADAHPEQSAAEKEADRIRVLDVYVDFCEKMRVKPDPLILPNATRHRDPDDVPPAPQTDFEKRIAAREAADREAARQHCDAVQERGDTSPTPLSADFDAILDEIESWPETEIGERNP